MESSRKLRVGIFSNSYRPVISGVVNSIDLTRKELLRQGHHPFLFTAGARGGSPHAGLFSYPSVSLSSKVYYPVPFPFSFHNAAVLRNLRLDVVHTHHPFLLSQVAVATARKQRIPLVYTFHTQFEQYAHYVSLPQGVVRWFSRRAVHNFCNKCQLIIAPSPNITALLEEYGVRSWTVTLPNAINLGDFRPHPVDRARFGLAPDDVVALYAGRVGREKNLEFMVRCFATVARQDPRRKLMVVGEGPERLHLEELAHDLEVGPQTRFVGAVAYADMPAYYASADFFTMTSVTEVKPLVILEAMASGLPVVAVAACGSKDTITHEKDGLLSPSEETGYAAVLERAFGDQEALRCWGQHALQTSKQYGIENYVRRLAALYSEARGRL